MTQDTIISYSYATEARLFAVDDNRILLKQPIIKQNHNRKVKCVSYYQYPSCLELNITQN